jgi:hypothetical protein
MGASSSMRRLGLVFSGYALGSTRLIVGSVTSDVPSDYRSDFTNLVGRPRVWILIAAGPPESRRALMSFLAEVGTRKRSFRTNDDIAVAGLYDLRAKVPC